VYSVVLVANCRAPVDERVAAELLCAPDDDGSVGESGVFDFGAVVGLGASAATPSTSTNDSWLAFYLHQICKCLHWIHSLSMVGSSSERMLNTMKL
jgi:hypothetical protein